MVTNFGLVALLLMVSHRSRPGSAAAGAAARGRGESRPRRGARGAARVNRSIRRLYLALAGGFVLLVLLLGYWQVVAAGGLNDRAGNPQALQRERLIDRGRIVSRRRQDPGRQPAVRVQGRRVYQRVYPQGTLAPHVIGYATPSAAARASRAPTTATWPAASAPSRCCSGST